MSDFVGLHVAFCYVGGINYPTSVLSIYGPVQSAETMDEPGISTASAPAYSGRYLECMMTVTTQVDAWITTGPTPADPSLPNSPRRIVFANTPVDFFCAPGDKVAWVAA